MRCFVIIVKIRYIQNSLSRLSEHSTWVRFEKKTLWKRCNTERNIMVFTMINTHAWFFCFKWSEHCLSNKLQYIFGMYIFWSNTSKSWASSYTIFFKVDMQSSVCWLWGRNQLLLSYTRYCRQWKTPSLIAALRIIVESFFLMKLQITTWQSLAISRY